ncbi:MAG: hypothetical protein ACOYON_11635 [Fimbriimonas sp.]
MAKISKPILYTLVLAAVVYAASLLSAPEAPKSSKRTTARATATSAKKGDLFLKEDYEAKFEPVNIVAKDAFKPLIARANSGAVESAAPNAIPTAFAGGEPNWIFTGCSEMDGSVMALVENTTNGEGGFLKKGDRWKTSVVENVGEDTLTLRASDGTTKVVRLFDGIVESPAGDVQPVRPALNGPIGNVAVVPVNPGTPNPTEGRQRAN